MTLDEFVSRLARAKRSGSAYAARCPAHEDKLASLSVSEGDDGRILVKCHAGCATEDVVRKLGLELRDLFPEGDARRDNGGSARARTARSGGSWEARIDRTYDYVDEVGTLLYQSVRLRDPKDFRQRRPTGKDAWKWKLDDVRRVPYRLPELLRAIEEGRAVWVVEGEKDVEALEEIGLVATCNPMGAGSWLDEYALHFRGAPWVLIAADCDEAGRKHAATVAHSLHDAGVRSKVIDLDPEREDGHDVSDYIVKYGDDAQFMLRELARETKRWTPAATAPAILIPAVSSEEFMRRTPSYDETKDYLGPFFRGGRRVTIAGAIGHGKTSLLMEAASATAQGTDFLGWRGSGARVIYIDLEMGQESITEAMVDARLPHPNFAMWSDEDGLQIDKNSRHRKMIETACETYDVVVIDPFHKLIEGELEYASVRMIVDYFDSLKKRYPRTCVVVGFHAQQPKSRRDHVLLGSISGFKAFQRNADLVLTIQRIDTDTSRIRWEKVRGSRLGVKADAQWVVKWEQGQGFHRGERQTLKQKILAVLDEEFYLTTPEIAEELGAGDRAVRRALADLAVDDFVEKQGGEGGRGHSASWRKRRQSEKRAA